MKKLLPIALLAASLGAPNEANAADGVDYSSPELSAMCDPDGGSIYLDIVVARKDVNKALSEVLVQPSKAELADTLSHELLDALYDELNAANANPEAVLSVLSNLQVELDHSMSKVDYSNSVEVTLMLSTISNYMKGLNNLSVLLSSLANDNGRALTRRQLLERYESDLDTVDRAWRVDNALTALDELDLPAHWDCSPIVSAYGANGELPMDVTEMEALEDADKLTWVTPEIQVITGPQYVYPFPENPDVSTERRNRQALSEAYEAASKIFEEIADDLQPIVDQFGRRQGIVVFEKDDEPPVDLVWEKEDSSSK